MTYEQIDARKEYVRRARASFQEQENGWTDMQPAPETNPYKTTFAIRLVLGLLLFLAFVLADLTDSSLFDYSAKQVAAEIEKEDYTNLEKYVMMLFTDAQRI